MARFVKLSSGQRINLDTIVRLIPGPFHSRNELVVICVSPEANFNLRDDRDILDLLKAVDGPQDVPFSECKSPDCPIGCPDSHAATPARPPSLCDICGHSGLLSCPHGGETK